MADDIVDGRVGFVPSLAYRKSTVLGSIRRNAYPNDLQKPDTPLLLVAARIAILLSTVLLSLSYGPLISQAAEVDLPQIDPAYTIHVDAESYATVQRGDYDVLAFEGNCVLRQGSFTAKAEEIILWIERAKVLNTEYAGKVICYCNGRSSLDWGNGQRLTDHRWQGRLFSMNPVSVDSGREVTRYDIPNLDWGREPYSFHLTQFDQSQDTVLMAPPLLGQSGPNNVGRLAAPSTLGQRQNQVQPTPGAVSWDPNASIGGTRSSDFIPQSGLVIPNNGAPYPAAGNRESLPAPEPLPSSNPSGAGSMAPAFPSQQPSPQVVQQVPTPEPFAAKTIQFLPRQTIAPTITHAFDEVAQESVWQIRGGFKMVVQGVQITNDDGTVTDYGTVSLEADNAVAWIRSDGAPDFFGGFTSTADRPVELYLEGNIVFFQGNRVIYAERMYYNVASEYGMVLSAEVITPVPQFQGMMRLKADVLQQRDSRNFKAFGAAITSSRLGVPRYWMQSGDIEFQDNRREEEALSVFAPSDPNRPTNMNVRARDNRVYVAGVPIFYWPTLKTDLREPDFYISKLKFKNDTIFGFQTYVDWNLYKLLGIDPPEGTKLRLSTDYLSDRGPAIGARFDYARPTWLFGAPGYGFTEGWFIKDEGLDVLGLGRINLPPEEEIRGKLRSQHRIFLSPDWELSAETGWLSDRNFLEQFYEREWDQEKDYATALRLRRYNGHRMFEVYGQTRINDFFTETEWLPRVDQYWLGQDLFAERATWSSHNHVGYGHQRVATAPINAREAAQTTTLPWETDSEGIRAATRQELSIPFAMGAFKVVPFLSGEAAFWKEDVNQDDVVRLTGQAGVRASLPMWQVNPNVENRLFDLRGLAHKMTFESEFFYADSNQDLDRFPLYDPLDDNAQEHFRKRFVLNTFGGTIPERFDERNFAVRSGMQRYVTGSTEIADDMTQLRMGLNNRWQTKRGLPGRERIVDLVSFDADFTYFPRSERDNFGEDVGALTYDFRYHVGDRLTLLSDGYFDVFSQGLKAVSLGGKISRPGRGDLYVGMLSLEGPISANILNGYLNYRMNEKWIISSGAAFDFGSAGNLGQNLNLIRVGESGLIQLGFLIDHVRDNVSFNFSIEPRFFGLGRVGGRHLVPPAGLYGIE